MKRTRKDPKARYVRGFSWRSSDPQGHNTRADADHAITIVGFRTALLGRRPR